MKTRGRFFGVRAPGSQRPGNQGKIVLAVWIVAIKLFGGLVPWILVTWPIAPRPLGLQQPSDLEVRKLATKLLSGLAAYNPAHNTQMPRSVEPWPIAPRPLGLQQLSDLEVRKLATKLLSGLAIYNPAHNTQMPRSVETWQPGCK